VRNAARDGLQIRAAASARDAVDGADLIVVATASTTPVLESAWVPDGAHVCAIGACRPAHRELQAQLVARSRVFVDSTAGALAEAGDIVMAIQERAIAPEHIAGELGALVSGTVAGRQAPGQVTLFKSLGMAVEDVAAARLAFTRASAAGVGTALVL
jgi:ornithine cyclodeaminase